MSTLTVRRARIRRHKRVRTKVTGTASRPMQPSRTNAQWKPPVMAAAEGWPLCKSVVVRVNDRGPFHAGRVIDLSYAAANRIGIAQRGSGEVEVESLLPVDAPVTVAAAPLPPVAATEVAAAAPIPLGREAGGYVVQLAAFANNVNAQAFVTHVANQTGVLGVEAKVHETAGLYRVVVGPYPTRDDAKRTADRLRDAFGLDGMIKPH